MRPEVDELVRLGPLPADDALDGEAASRLEDAIEGLPPLLTGDEAVALVAILPPDDSTAFGLAWSLLHAVEASPEWPVWGALDDRSWWVTRYVSAASAVASRGHPRSARTCRCQLDPAGRTGHGSFGLVLVGLRIHFRHGGLSRAVAVGPCAHLQRARLGVDRDRVLHRGCACECTLQWGRLRNPRSSHLLLDSRSVRRQPASDLHCGSRP